jgi:hypothetical protein
MNTFVALALACLGEAQIIGTISKVVPTETGCRAFIGSVSYYQDSGVCPLDDSRISYEGFEIGQNAAGECNAEAGDRFSGVLVDKGDYIELE